MWLGPFIETERLRLYEMNVFALESLLRDDVDLAGQLMGLVIPREFLETIDVAYLENQRDLLVSRPRSPGWCVRVITRKEDDQVIGHAGFHGHPDDTGRAELGYLIFEVFRNRGYASEAVVGLVEWANEQGVATAVATVSANNLASIRVASRAGFLPIGVELSVRDGEVRVFESRRQHPS